MEIINEDRLRYLAGKHNLSMIYLEKDFYLTLLLYLIKDVKGLHFKGGTALYKIFLNNLRLSEDIDFTVKGNLKKVEQQIREKIKSEKVFKEITHDKKTKHFTRLIVHYASPYGSKNHIIIDLNTRAKTYLKTEEHELKHFYKDYIPKFEVKTLNIKELVAEKIAAMVQRYAPRDYYDIYNIVKKKLPIDMKLVKQKFKDDKEEFDIGRIFKRSYKIHNKWESDLLPLTTTKPSFKEVIQTLTKFFKYKEYKEKLKK